MLCSISISFIVYRGVIFSEVKRDWSHLSAGCRSSQTNDAAVLIITSGYHIFGEFPSNSGQVQDSPLDHSHYTTVTVVIILISMANFTKQFQSARHLYSHQCWRGNNGKIDDCRLDACGRQTALLHSLTVADGEEEEEEEDK